MMLLDLGNLSMSCISRGWCSVSFGILNGLSDSLLQSFRPISPHQVSTVHVEISGFCEHTGDVSYNLHMHHQLHSFHCLPLSSTRRFVTWSVNYVISSCTSCEFRLESSANTWTTKDGEGDPILLIISVPANDSQALHLPFSKILSTGSFCCRQNREIFQTICHAPP